MADDEKLFEQLNKLRNSKTVIVGVGNTLKGDDGAGPKVCQQLAGKISAELIDVGTVPENYIQPIIKKAPQNLLIIDAIDFKEPAGTTKLFKPEQINQFTFSTHTLSPRVFVDMICKSINVDVYLIGIQPEQTTLGQSLSEPINRAVEKLISTLTEIFPPAAKNSKGV